MHLFIESYIENDVTLIEIYLTLNLDKESKSIIFVRILKTN